jgi:hypothetical protein
MVVGVVVVCTGLSGISVVLRGVTGITFVSLIGADLIGIKSSTVQ